MHYRNERCPEFPVAEVEPFLALMERVNRAESSEVQLDQGSLPQTVEVMVLKPAL
jgi:hypothetical protein